MRNFTALLTAHRSARPAVTAQRAYARPQRLAGLALVLGALALLVSACGATPRSGGGTPTPGGGATPTANPSGATVKVYFTRHPDSDNDPTKVFALTRTAPASAVTVHDKATYALEQMLSGPTQTERAQGYYNPFDGQIALQSYCSGAFRDFDLTLDHRGATAETGGATAETGVATLQFCRRVDIPGELAGPRMSAMITSTLLQFPGITKVAILNYRGDCFDDLQGANACLKSQQTGYTVNVYFSRHPDSDGAPTKLFPVQRTSPTLAVATYALSQLIAGPTAAEAAQGFYTPLQGAPHGASTCGGADFTITLNMNRSQPETGAATLQFCREMPGFGDTGAAIVRNEITSTLTQFPTIQKVVIVDQHGACFDDLIGCP